MVSPGTAARDLGVLHHLVETARLQLGIPFGEDLFKGVQKPKEPPSRDRRLDLHEEETLLQGCNKSPVTYLKPIITLASETAMRRGEILAIQWDDNNEFLRTLRILFRYTHLRAEDVAEKIHSMQCIGKFD